MCFFQRLLTAIFSLECVWKSSNPSLVCHDVEMKTMGKVLREQTIKGAICIYFSVL